MRLNNIFLVVAIVLIGQMASAGPGPKTLYVPADYVSIQAGINAATNGDTVRVSPGTYSENLNFKGKAITLISDGGPYATIIDGGRAGPVVTCHSGEGLQSVISGFTLQNGEIQCAGGYFGAGVSLQFSSATIVSNIFRNNIQVGGGEAGGIGGWNASPIIENNLFFNNSAQYDGSIVGVIGFMGGSPVIANNIIASNSCLALNCNADGSTVVVNNTFVGNPGGISASAGTFCNNVLVNNDTGVGNAGTVWQNNLVFGGQVLYSTQDLTGTNGNISTDPWFACQPGGDYHLLPGSPCIDAGTNGAPLLPAVDFDGNPRTRAGNSKNAPVVDMGAFEFNPLSPPVPCMFLNCPADIVVLTAVGQNSAVVNFPNPTGTPNAAILCLPPSGSAFLIGTNVVLCTATYGTNTVNCQFNIKVYAPSPVIITNQPGSRTNAAGTTAAFSVGASGTPPLGYQWFFSGTNIVGETNAALAINNVLGANTGNYFVVVSNVCGTVTSSVAKLTVLDPTITTQPASLAVQPGSNAVFSVGVIGSPPFTYQWLKDGTPLIDGNNVAGSANDTLTVSNVSSSDVAAYSVGVTNYYGSVTSSIAKLILYTPEYHKANNTNDLNLGSSWIEGVPPGATAIAIWDSAVTSANTCALGGDIYWGGIRIADVGGAVMTTNAARYLNVGQSGIDMHAAANDFTVKNFLKLTASQTWDIAAGKTLTVASNLLASTIVLTLQGAGNVVFAANVSGGPSIIKKGDGIVSVVGTPATFNGRVTIEAGTLIFNRNGLLYSLAGGGNVVNNDTNQGSAGLFIQGSMSGFTGTMTMNAGTLSLSPSQGCAGSPYGTFIFNNTMGTNLLGSDGSAFSGTIEFGSLSGTANLYGNQLYYGSGTKTFSVGALNTSTTLSGAICNAIGVGASIVALTKVGTGTFMLTGTNAYTGPTAVSNGTLYVNSPGSLASGSTVTVYGGATLGGTGIIAGPVLVTNGATLSPGGTGLGTLTLSNTLTLAAGSTNVLRINKTGSVCTSDTVNLAGGYGVTYNGTLTVVTTSNSAALAAYDKFTLFAARAGSLTGSFLASNLPPLGAGLVWDIGGLSVDGTIQVLPVSTVAPPVFSPVAGLCIGAQTVSIYCDTPGATIYYTAYYTTNGITQTTNSSSGASGLMVTVPPIGIMSITAYAAATGMTNSLTKSATYETGMTGIWANPSGGSWMVPGNWMNNIIGQGRDFTNDFSTLTLTTNVSVTLDGFPGIGALLFGDMGNTYSWTVNPGTPAGTLTLAARALPVVQVNNPATTIAAVIAGTNGLAKTGRGVLKLAANNIYTGPTVVSTGVLQLDILNALTTNTTIYLGDANSGTNPVTLKIGPSLASGTVAAAFPIVVSSNAPSAQVSIDNNPASTAVAVNSGSITLQNHDLWITNSGIPILQLNGKLTGTGNVYVATGAYGRRARFAYNGDDFAGNVYIINGGVQTGTGSPNSTSDAIPNNADVFMSPGTTLGLGASDTFGGLNGGASDLANGIPAAVVKPNISGNGTQSLSLGTNSHNAVYSGDLGDESAGHVMTVIKTGTGTQTFNGNCTFTGSTALNGGTLIINSNYNSVISISTNAVLGGVGVFYGAVTNKGTLAPGSDTPGTLTFVNLLTLTNNCTNVFRINKNGPVLTSDQINLVGTNGLSYNGRLIVVSNANSDAFAAYDRFTLFAKRAGAFSGSFASSNLPPLGTGLVWFGRNLAIDGSMEVLPVNTVAPPVFSPAAGSYAGAQTVAIYCGTPGATIYYTTNGNTPTSASPSGTNGATIIVPVNTTMTIQAFARTNGLSDSLVASATYATRDAGIWNNPAGGSWLAAGNWTDNAIGQGRGLTDYFNTLTLATNSVATLDGAVTIGNLCFGDTGNHYNWTVNAGIYAGALTLDAASPPTIQVDNQTATITAAIGGTNGLIKTGAGILTLTASNSLTGDTLINNGTMLVNGSLATGSTVTVNSGATLGGIGAARGTVAVNGTLAPGGNSNVGTLATGAETWNGGGSCICEINATNTSGADRLNVTGTLNGQAVSGNPFTVKLATLTPGNLPGPLTNFNKFASYTWTLATASGGITNFAATNFTVDASSFSNDWSGGSFTLTVAGTNLNLNYVAAPMPKFTGVILSGGALQLGGTGVAGQNHILQCATNLTPPIIWSPIATNIADTHGVFQFTDPQTTNNQNRFYRITIP